MKPAVIIRKNRFFSIDEKVLPEKANKTNIKLALYAALHEEFKGAAFSTSYKHLTPEKRIQQMNNFAWKWLEDRGY
jgi:hypothetical protein